MVSQLYFDKVFFDEYKICSRVSWLCKIVFIFWAMSSVFFGSTYNAEFPRISGRQVVLLAKTGMFCAKASKGGNPKPSDKEI